MSTEAVRGVLSAAGAVLAQQEHRPPPFAHLILLAGVGVTALTIFGVKWWQGRRDSTTSEPTGEPTNLSTESDPEREERPKVNDRVMVILRWDDDANTALERYERAIAAWRARSDEHSAEPAVAFAGRSDRGGLVVVNVFATEGDHRVFHTLGSVLEEVGLARPDVERVVLEPGWSPASAGD